MTDFENDTIEFWVDENGKWEFKEFPIDEIPEEYKTEMEKYYHFEDIDIVYLQLGYPKKTEFFCPKCSRMLYTDGNILPSMPPQINVACHNCGYEGTRRA